MRKIAIIADGWRKFINYAWIRGCKDYIGEHDLDVTIHVFNSFGNFSMDEKYNAGEYNIFHLPEFREYDGIILELTNVADQEVKEDLISRVKESGVPAVSLMEEIPGLYHSGIDNYAAMEQMVEHMITVHGNRRLGFVGGPKENTENQRRFQAYRDVLKRHGITYEEENVYFGDYQVSTGVRAFDYFEQAKKIPEVFICANDNIAVGICHQAQAKGYQVPRDFRVTGYDNFDKAAYYKPRISTVGVTREKIAYRAMSLLDEIWDKGDAQPAVYVDVDLVFQDSCGCPVCNPMSRGQYVSERIFADDNEIKLQNELLALKRALINCRSFEEMAVCLPENLQMFSYEELYILINKDILECEEAAMFEGTGEEDYRVKGYPDDMEVLVAYRGKEALRGCIREPGRLIPGREDTTGGGFYLFTPLHFRDCEVGYIILKNCDYLMDTQMIFEVLNVFLEMMENMYHRIILSRMNQKLSTLYIMDSLTGLYNRMAYNRLAVPLFEQEIRKKEPLLIMFVDVDRLKYINDTFGHDMGNVAIQAVASAIRKCCPQDGVAMRYGGDEFIVLIPKQDREEAELLVKRLQDLILQSEKSLDQDFPVEASIGYVIADDESKSLNEYINLADEQMYCNKKAKHVERQ